MDLKQRIELSQQGEYELSPEEVLAAMRLGYLTNFGVREGDGGTVTRYMMELEEGEKLKLTDRRDGFFYYTLERAI